MNPYLYKRRHKLGQEQGMRPAVKRVLKAEVHLVTAISFMLLITACVVVAIVFWQYEMINNQADIANITQTRNATKVLGAHVSKIPNPTPPGQ